MNILIIDDDLTVAHGVAEVLAGPGRRIIISRDAASAELVIDHERVALAVADIRLTGQFRYEGLELIEYVRARSPSCVVVVMSGHLTPEVETEALRRGAMAALQKPFGADDLEAFFPQESGEGECTVVEIPALDDVIYGRTPIVPRFQPIVRLSEPSEAFAFEALCRVQTNSILARPDLLFDYASRLKRVTELEVAATTASLQTGSALTDPALLFVNVHPAALLQGRQLAKAIVDTAATLRFPLERLVLELTEQEAIRVDDQLESTFATLRAQGVRFAFDDVGSAYSHLSLIDVVRPEFLKVSQHFGTDFETDPTRTKLVHNLLSLARDFRSELILEGIESEATARAALDAGISLGQGYYFERPAPPDALAHWLGAAANGRHRLRSTTKS